MLPQKQGVDLAVGRVELTHPTVSMTIEHVNFVRHENMLNIPGLPSFYEGNPVGLATPF